MLEFAQIVLIAAEERGLDPNIVRPGWVALGVVALLGVATFLLSRSFLKHTKRAEQPWAGDDTDA